MRLSAANSTRRRTSPRRYRRRGAFSLVELLFAMIIIGILTAVGFWRISNEKQKATKAKLVETLDHLMVTEEAYATQYDAYTTDLAAMQFQALDYITVVVTDVDPLGFHAVASENTYGIQCFVAYGDAAITAPLTTYNTPACIIP